MTGRLRDSFAPKTEFRELIQYFSAFRSAATKILLPFFKISAYHNRIPPRCEGRIAIVTTREAGCDGRGRAV
jgi:hypothetical protein